MPTFTGEVHTADVTPYTYRARSTGPEVLQLKTGVNPTITVAPDGPSWAQDVIVVQPAGGSITVTWAGVTFFGGTPTIASSANAETVIHFFSPDGVTVFGYGVGGSSSGLSVPQSPPSEPVQSSVDVVQTAPTTAAYGFTQAQATALLAFANAAVTDIGALVSYVDALQAKLVAAGIL